MKKIYVMIVLGSCVVLLQSAVKNSGVPPQGRTGATGNTCRSCHGDFPLNSSGSVTVIGLPTSGYVPNTSYPFSLQINHNSSDRSIWGFSIKAVTSSGASIGTFSSSNPRVAPNGTELSHNGAATSTPATNSFTYNNLVWKAPAAASGPVSFYYVAVAGNSSGSDGGDYVYTGLNTFTLPIKLQSFTAVNEMNTVVLNWKTAGEINSNFFEIERSDDGQFYFSLGKVNANPGAIATSTYSFRDNKATGKRGNLFYRLKMVDKDGSIKYSNVVSIKPNNTTFAINNVYPTILKSGDRINVEAFSDINKNLEVVIMDEVGKIYSRQVIGLINGDNNLKVTLPNNLPKGMIFIRFNTDNFQQTESLIVR